VISIEHRRAEAMGDPWRILSDLGTDGTMAGLSCAAKATGVLVGAGLVALTMRRRAAATRHLIWSLGLAGALAMLPLAFALPRWGVPVLEAPARAEPTMVSRPVSEVQSSERRAVMEMPVALDEGPATLPGASPIESNVAVAPQMAWPLWAWVAGTLVVLAWGATGWASTWWMGRNARRVTDPVWVALTREAAERVGTHWGVTLLSGERAAMPLTWGVLRPTLLLPEEADQWPDDRRRAVLLHELAHVRRRDCLTQWLGLATCAAYWFNPLAWWAASRLRTEREQACDDLVLEAGERPSDYATQLLGVARSLRAAHTMGPAAIAMARPSGLETRLLAILDAWRNRRSPSRWLVFACLTVVLTVSAPLAAVRLVAKERPRPVLSGQVVGTNGKPCTGAEVVVVASRFRWRYASSDKPAAELLGHGQSDEQGRFRIELAGEPESDEGRVILAATARDCGFAARELTDLNTTIAGPIQLPAEQPVEVRLVDLEGSPIAGALVHPVALYPAKGGAGLDSEILSHDFLPSLVQKWTTDRDGQFTVRGCGPDHTAFLEVRAPGFGKQRMHFELKPGVGTSTLALGRAHVVEGRVTLGKDGPPAVGARIEWRTMSEKYGIGMNLGNDEATTGKDGHYRIDAAPGASIVLKVFPPREGADAYLIRGDLVVPGDSVKSRVDFALPKGVLVRGRITEAATGRPVAGAVVYHQAQERNNPYFIKGNPAVFNPDERRVVTAADGTFRLGIMPGPGYLLVKGPTGHYLHEEISGVELYGDLIWPNTRHYPDAYRKLSPKPDEGPVDVAFTLRRGATVHGHVVDQDGQAVREAQLVSRWYLSKSGIEVNKGPTEKSVRGGRFELDGCDPTTSASVLFLDVKNQRGAAIELSGKQAGEDVIVTMRPCGSASVRIVDDRGKPVRAGRSPAHLEVVLSPGASWGDIRFDNQKTSPLMADAIHASNLDIDRYRDIKTDTNGRMTFPTLIPGATYRIIVLNQQEKMEIEFTVEPGEAKELGDLKIRNLERAG
jgi:beta-lactamase regulating signal transducer with metallopeptidase domain/protocatechuate 3,4-dioxygenase beta subunit